MLLSGTGTKNNTETSRRELMGIAAFNHIVAFPVKNGKEFPIFDYQEAIFDALEQNQNIWIKKARGIGVTTFLIRYLVWKILYSQTN